MAAEDKEIILLKVSGHDKIGVTAGLTAVLAAYDANILDIGQADIHDTLSLGILFEIAAGSSSAPGPDPARCPHRHTGLSSARNRAPAVRRGCPDR
mgnify:CR=1 FL=1